MGIMNELVRKVNYLFMEGITYAGCFLLGSGPAFPSVAWAAWQEINNPNKAKQGQLGKQSDISLLIITLDKAGKERIPEVKGTAELKESGQENPSSQELLNVQNFTTNENGEAYGQYRSGRGLHADAETRNNIGTVTGGGCVRNRLHRAVNTGIIFGDDDDHDGQDQPHQR